MDRPRGRNLRTKFRDRASEIVSAGRNVNFAARFGEAAPRTPDQSGKILGSNACLRFEMFKRNKSDGSIRKAILPGFTACAIRFETLAIDHRPNKAHRRHDSRHRVLDSPR